MKWLVKHISIDSYPRILLHEMAIKNVNLPESNYERIAQWLQAPRHIDCTVTTWVDLRIF